MKSKAVPLKVWVGIFLVFVAFQYFNKLYFEEKIFFPREKSIQSDGHFFRLEHDFKNADPDELKVAVIGSSRVAKGIECPDDVRLILAEQGLPSFQLNKIWESYDPFEMLIKDKNLLEKLIPLQPDLILIQSEMLAIHMSISDYYKDGRIEKRYKKFWDLEYEGDEKQYLPKQLKYQSKLNQELVFYALNGNMFEQGKGPCSIRDNYAVFDTINPSRRKSTIKKFDDMEYVFEDLEKLKKAGIKVVIIETPYPHLVEKEMRKPQFLQELEQIKSEYKDRFDIDYWGYEGSTLYFKYYADAGHLNPEGRAIYTRWLVEKINQEILAN